MIDINELERQLAGDGEPVGSPDLAAIHRLGRRRRTLRTVAAGGGAALATAAVVGAFAVVGGGGKTAIDPADQPTPEPQALSPLAQRALEEIPGAVQLSPGSVSIPEPDGASMELGDLTPVDVVGEPVELSEPLWAGVTTYEKGTFPDWLYDGTTDIERAEGDESGYPMGTTDITGVHVEAMPPYLGCIGPMGGQDFSNGATCTPAVLTRQGDRWSYSWGMGSERFLEPGAPMEVFTWDGFENGADTTMTIAGIDGTTAVRAELVATDGTVAEGDVLAGTMVEGDTIVYGEVPGELARVVLYDADGDVVDDHKLRDCDDPVDCEVR